MLTCRRPICHKHNNDDEEDNERKEKKKKIKFENE